MSKAFTATVFRWLHQVNADTKLPASAAKVAIRLSPDFNEQRGGMAWSAFKTMADDIGLSERAVIRDIRALEARGHLRVKWGKQGRGHSSQYWMLERQPDLFEDEDEKPAPAPVFEKNKTGASGTVKPAPVVVKPALAPEILSRLTDQPSRGTHRVPKTQPPRVRSPKKKETGGEDIAAAFELFWSVFPRQVAREPARKEFAKATKTIDPQIIIEAAKLYAVVERARIAREGKPECTKYPGYWLRDRRWEDPPPPGTVIDNETGNVVAVEQPPSQHSGGGDRVMEMFEETRAELAKTNPWWAS